MTAERSDALTQLWFWQHNPGTNFASLLYTLFSKADPDNMRKLAAGFPVEYSVWHEWYRSEDPAKFWKTYGFEPP